MSQPSCSSSSYSQEIEWDDHSPRPSYPQERTSDASSSPATSCSAPAQHAPPEAVRGVKRPWALSLSGSSDLEHERPAVAPAAVIPSEGDIDSEWPFSPMPAAGSFFVSSPPVEAPTPLSPVQIAPALSPPPRQLTGPERRLLDIQIALARCAGSAPKKARVEPPPPHDVPALASPPARRPQPRSPSLSEEQQRILAFVLSGQSAFITGAAGTGKSVLLRKIIDALKSKHRDVSDAVLVTAPNAMAACNIGGSMIQSLAGVQMGTEDVVQLAQNLRGNEDSTLVWLRTQVLIIDEVSMLDADIFDKLAEIGSLVRGNPMPFGGIQLVVTGDFVQLPPVTEGCKAIRYAFEARHWKQATSREFQLTMAFRHRGDPKLLDCLRSGLPLLSSMFEFLSAAVIYVDGLAPLALLPSRRAATLENSRQIGLLASPVVTFVATDGGTLDDDAERRHLLSSFLAVHTLELACGAQVMLIKDLDASVVSGCLGFIQRFRAAEGGVVGLSDGQVEYPEVTFVLPNSCATTVLVTPQIFQVQTASGKVAASRVQLPLVLGWALNIHESQGQTLPRVKVDLARFLHPDQVYVALSRARSLATLQVLNFKEGRKVVPKTKVLEWSKTLRPTVPLLQP